MATGRLILRAYGRVVAIEGAAACRDLAAARLSPTYRRSDLEPEAVWRVRRSGPSWLAYRSDGSLLGGSHDPVATVELMLSDLELWVAEHARSRIFVHAGCVVVDGRAIVLPGRSMSGKSSLTAALVRAGAEYYSDEYAVLDARGLVRPYPRELSIRPFEGGPTQRVSPASLGATVGRTPRPIGLVAVLRYQQGARWSTAPISQAVTVLRLLDNTVPARSRARAALQALGAGTGDCIAVEGRRGSADVTAARLIRMVQA
jgi:hypothetical protein